MTILDGIGLPRMCNTVEGCTDRATPVWSTGVIAGGASAGERYSCDRHNPWSNVALTLPLSFHSQSLCHACGQPVSVGSLIANQPGRP